MTPTPQDHEAAARRRANHLHEHLVGSAHTPNGHLGCGGCNAIRGEMNRVAREHDCAAALAEAVRVARQEEQEATKELRTWVAERIEDSRRALDANIDPPARLRHGSRLEVLYAVKHMLRARSEAQATPAPEKATTCGATITPNDMTYECRLEPNHPGEHEGMGGSLTWGTPPETKERGR